MFSESKILTRLVAVRPDREWEILEGGLQTSISDLQFRFEGNSEKCSVLVLLERHNRTSIRKVLTADEAEHFSQMLSPAVRVDTFKLYRP